MTTTTNDVVMGETGIDPEAGSQTAGSSGATGNANEGDTSGSGDEKFVPMSRFKEVIDQRNEERGAVKQLRQEHDQLLNWVHHEVVPAIEKMKSAGDAVRTDAAQEDVYVDPLEATIKAQQAELAELKRQMSEDKNAAFSRNFTQKVETLCGKYELASGAEIVDAYLKNPSQSFDFDAAAKRSHEKNERKMDSYSKKRAASASAKKLSDSTPAQLAMKNPPKNMIEARELARAHFRDR